MAHRLASYVRAEGWLGREVIYYPVVDSTNDVVLAAAARDGVEGLVVVADEQRLGRGRLQRRWEAPAESSLLVSLLFRPPEPFDYHATRTLMAVGLALLDTVRNVVGIEAQLKWPNDLIVNGERSGWRKLAGMLSEVGVSGSGEPVALVVGVGLNVNIAPKSVMGLGPNASSLLTLTGHRVSRVQLLAHLLAGAEQRVEGVRQGVDLAPEWRAALAWIGQRVMVDGVGERVVGLAEDVDGEGALLLRLPDGGLRRFTAGDVTLRRA